MAMKFRGLKSLEAKLKKIPAEARSAIKQALAESADETVATMKNLAPVSKTGSHGWEPGMLRESIVATFGDGSTPKYAAFTARKGRRRVKAADPDLSVTITAGNEDVRYAHLVEFGTAPHVNGGRFKGSQHPGTQAQPFFYPGYRANKKKAAARIKRAVKRGIQAAARGGSV